MTDYTCSVWRGTDSESHYLANATAEPDLEGDINGGASNWVLEDNHDMGAISTMEMAEHVDETPGPLTEPATGNKVWKLEITISSGQKMVRYVEAAAEPVPPTSGWWIKTASLSASKVNGRTVLGKKSRLHLNMDLVTAVEVTEF